ncbi:MAG: hypothetical protein WAK31_22005 [Chthoniobacterales bacterium]
MATSETRHSAEAALARTLQALVRAVHLKNGALPQVCWLMPPGALSEHPPRDEFKPGEDPEERSKKTLKYIELPEEVRWGDYGFHELVARGLARSAMFDMEQKRLLLEYLTPAEIAEFDVPINWKLVDSKGGDPKFGVPKRIAYRRFAESKGIDPDNEEAVSDAFRNEVWRRFQEKEGMWRQNKGD